MSRENEKQVISIDLTAQAVLPPVSLIICSRNRPQLLCQTVQSVLAGEQVPAEIVIVDQSDLPNLELASSKNSRACNVRYLQAHSTGLSRARNTAIANAAYEIIACIDDDMFVAPGWFEALVRPLIEAGPRTVVTGRVLPAEAEAPGGFVPALVLAETGQVYRGRLDRDVLAGGHMAAFRSSLVEMGGFDERLGAGSTFPAADDNDLGFRLLEAGYSIHYVPEAILYHRAWRSKRDYLPIRWNYGRGKGGFYAKYMSLKDRHMLRRLVWDIGRRVWRLPRLVFSQPGKALGDVIYSLGIFSGWALWSLTQFKEKGFAKEKI